MCFTVPGDKLHKGFTWIHHKKHKEDTKDTNVWKLTEDYGHLKRVGATVRAIAQKLRAKWPAEADAMPYYPAFREGI
jgi:hypothetical protein